MKRKVLYLAFLLLFVNYICSQDINKIQGVVIDKDSYPLEFVSIGLISSIDSSYIDGTISDSDGNFYFDLSNEYMNTALLLKISLLGYKTQIINLELTTNKPLPIIMEENPVILNDIIVSGSMPQFKLKGNSLITNVENTILSNLGTANDILEKIPGVIQEDGEYKLIAKGNILIFIDNRKISNYSELDKLNSNDIVSIELISTPASEYGVDVRAVIRIKTKGSVRDGLSSIIRFRGTQGTRFGDNLYLALSYNINKLTILANFYNNNTRLKASQINNQIVNGILNDWYSVIDMPNWKHNYKYSDGEIGVNYEISKSHNLMANYNLTHSDDFYRGYTATNLYEDDILFDNFSTNVKNRNRTTTHLLNITYLGNINKKTTLELNLDYIDKRGKRNQDILANNSLSIYNNESNNNLFALKAMLTQKISDTSSIKYGTYYSYINSESDFKSSYDNTSKTTENIYAFFVDYQHKISILDLNLGLRYENYGSKFYDNDLAKNKVYDYFYPSASIFFPIENLNMSLSFSRKSKRPTFYQLRNSTEYVSPFLYDKGNPYLKPVSIYDLSYSLNLKSSYGLEASYQYYKDYISGTFIPSDTDEKIIYLLNNNVSKYQLLNLTFYINKNVGIWNSNYSLSVIKPFFKDEYQGDLIKYNKERLYISANNLLKVHPNWTVNIDGKIYTSGNSGNSYVKAQSSLDVGLRTSFIDKRLNLNLQFIDIFNSLKKDIIMNNNYTNLEIYGKNDSRLVRLIVSYSFNTLKTKKNRSVNNDEINRL
jgi:hypothetical protein